ncbi:MAG: DNA repair protein RecO [Betaproteobacteria bacterium RIFCSPLOWO2_12_FULL_62_13]|nr:MAG: DNA repair protein RecO [Betaproteobacteria bacterium RIFCSPLOWO2_12_FULL_62_13]
MVRPADKSRQDGQPAFVLHSYPFRETSLIIQTFTSDLGRVALVARGARRPKSALRGVLLAFQPLLLSWSGRTELRTLHKAEWQGGHAPLKGLAVICGFYLNELLLKLLPRDDPHERLFVVYRETLEALGSGTEHAATLRRFEKSLLQELGYGLMLDRDAESGTPIAAEARYTYVIDRGPVVHHDDGSQNGVELSGQTLIDLQSDNYANAVTQQQSKTLMRALINHCLGDQTLHTRQLLRDLQAL